MKIYVCVTIACTCKEDVTFYTYITNKLWEETISSACLIVNTGVCLKSLRKRDQDIANGHDGLVTSKKLQVKLPSSGQETNRLQDNCHVIQYELCDISWLQ